jgi:hypothetical protein
MSTLHRERPSFVGVMRDIIARVPANTPLVTSILAGAAAISILAVAISAPTARTTAQATQTASVPPLAVELGEASTCKSQTWPYIDRSCTQQDANKAPALRAVRVISTDRVAPATLTATPVVLAAPVEVAQPGASAGAGASPGAAILSDSTVAAVRPEDEIVPMPKSRPTQLASVKHWPEAKLRRGLESAPIRAEDDDEGDDGVRVRAYATPDGRRITVYRYENPSDRRVYSRNEYYERRPVRMPFPFVSMFD